MMTKKKVNSAAVLADMAAQIKEGYAIKVAEFAKERVASYADNPELIAGMVTLLADAIIKPPKVNGRRRATPKHGTLRVSVNDGTPIVIDPYVSAKTTTRKFSDGLKEQAAFGDYNFLMAAHKLLAGREVLPYFDGEQRELTEKTARDALAASKLNAKKDGRTFKTWLRKHVCEKHRISQEKLTELTR
jgi:hypothetical protein